MKKIIAIAISSLILIFICYSVYNNKGVTGKMASKPKQKNDSTAYTKAAIKDYDDFVPYKVKKGDTVYGICVENVISFSANKASKMVMQKNNIKNNEDIKEGQIILIPYKNPKDDIEYMVKNGDSLASIAHNLMPAKSLADGVSEIMENNDLDSVNDIEQGQILLIPYNK